MNLREISNIPELTNEPTGFPNRIDSVISFETSSRTFTIEPSNTGGRFSYYIEGKEYRKTSSESKIISTATGLHFIYYDGTVLSETTSWTNDLIYGELAFIATIYWNNTTEKAVLIGDERHGIVMDGMTHAYLHNNIGTRYESGLTLSNYNLEGDGSEDSHAQLSLDNGTIWDEDIRHYIQNAVPQELYPVAKLPICYLSGNDWIRDEATSFPIKQGTTGIQYNLCGTGGVWSTIDATDGYYVAMWICATNDINTPLVAMLGQREDSSLEDAENNNQRETLILTNCPTLEYRCIYKLIFHTSSSYSNTPKARLVSIIDYRNISPLPRTNYVATDHNTLSGRGNLACHPAGSLTFDPSGNIISDTVQEAIEELDDEKSPIGHTHIEDDITDLEHNAIKIQGFPIDMPSTGEDRFYLQYNHTLGKWQLNVPTGLEEVSTSNPIATAKDIFSKMAVSEEESTTTSDEYQQKVRLTVTDIEPGEYMLAWSCAVYNGVANKGVAIRVQQDDSIVINEGSLGLVLANAYTVQTGFARVEIGTGGSAFFDLDFSRLPGAPSYTVGIRRARLYITRSNPFGG